MDVDVLAVQEVEDIDTLKAFNRDNLSKMYRYVTLIEGNDGRLIDVFTRMRRIVRYLAAIYWKPRS